MNQKIQASLMVLVVIVLGVLVFVNTNDSQPSETATTTTELTKEFTIRDGSLTFSYPDTASVSEENGIAKVQILGSGNQPNTEVSHGLTGFISLRDLESRPVAMWAELLFAQAKKKGAEGLRKVQEDSLGGRSGYSFQVQTQLNSTSTHYLLEADTGKFLHVSYDAVGPNKDDFIDQFASIVSTIQLKTDKQQERNTVTSTSADNKSVAQSCRGTGGEWLPQYHECEGVKESWCEKQGGEFDFCASACRHDPKAQACTQQCVQVCQFESGGE